MGCKHGRIYALLPLRYPQLLRLLYPATGVPVLAITKTERGYGSRTQTPGCIVFSAHWYIGNHCAHCCSGHHRLGARIRWPMTASDSLAATIESLVVVVLTMTRDHLDVSWY